MVGVIGQGSGDRGGWRHYVLMWDWHALSVEGWPGWDRAADGRAPWAVDLTRVVGTGLSSRELAVAWDDLARAAFYYRDWTESGTPFARPGDTYRSAFWFQTKAECDRFRAHFGL